MFIIPQNVEMDTYTNPERVDESAPYEELRTEANTSTWNISWPKLELTDTILGKGNFGEVREGVLNKDAERLRVAVKNLKSKNGLFFLKEGVPISSCIFFFFFFFTLS